MTLSLQGFLSQGPRKEAPASCGHLLDVFDKEAGYTIKKKIVCGDCYFAALGDGVEKHPIGHFAPHGAH